MGKKLFLFIFVGIVYLLYARFVLSPHLYKNFSLIDDGRSIDYGYYIRKCLTFHGCNDFKTHVLDAEVGTSRIGYWLIQGILYQGPALNAQFQHELRIYGLGLVLVFLLVSSALAAGSNVTGVVLGVVLFVTNYSFSENLIRLGPVEPYMVLFLGIFSLLFLNLQNLSKKWKLLAIFVSALTLIFFLLLKEVSIVVLPIMLILGILFPKILQRRVLITILIISGAIFVVTKHLLSTGTGIASNYVSEYRFDFGFIFKNAQNFLKTLSVSLSPFFELSVFIVPLTMIYKKFRQNILDNHFIYWCLVFVSFTAILFPWKYVLDRYLLPSIYAFSILISILVSRAMKEAEKITIFSGKRKILFRLGVFLVFTNLFFSGAPINIARTINYRNWFSLLTQFEADQVNAIAKNNDDTVYINAKDILNNWEVVYDIPLYLQHFHGGKPKTERLGNTFPTHGYLFTRTSLEPIVSLDALSKSHYPLLDSKTYYVPQIDPAAFRNAFMLRPIQTLQNPPFLVTGFSYYWEIRKL